tara:strand:- start:788 stop:904 length:117 start_codon:yes stop_codon:yes gene_type:complete
MAVRFRQLHQSVDEKASVPTLAFFIGASLGKGHTESSN